MAFTSKDVVKFAKLARIHIPEDQREQMAKDMGGIFDWIAQIAEVDTKGIEPLVTFGDKMPLSADIVSDGNKREDILKNAPDAYMDFFAVPKVIE